MLAAFAALAALVLDLAGLASGNAELWRWGGRSAPIAIALVAVCVVMLGKRGRVFWIIALLLLTLARWLRGSAGVAPDSPLVMLQLIATLLIVWRSVREPAS